MRIKDRQRDAEILRNTFGHNVAKRLVVLVVDYMFIQCEGQAYDSLTQKVDLAKTSLITIAGKFKAIDPPPANPATAITFWPNASKGDGFIQQLLTVTFTGTPCRHHRLLPDQCAVIPVPNQKNEQ